MFGVLAITFLLWMIYRLYSRCFIVTKWNDNLTTKLLLRQRSKAIYSNKIVGWTIITSGIVSVMKGLRYKELVKIPPQPHRWHKLGEVFMMGRGLRIAVTMTRHYRLQSCEPASDALCILPEWKSKVVINDFTAWQSKYLTEATLQTSRDINRSLNLPPLELALRK